MRALLLPVAMVIYLAGCAPVISDQSLRLVERGISFAELRQEPERQTGKYFLLGGAIAAVRNSSAGSELELVQFKTDESGKITDMAASGGRFLALSSAFLDPAIYRPGQLVSLVGEVRGKRTRLLGEVPYEYPVLAIREIHLWKPEEIPATPSFYFGFGIGTIIH